MAVQKLERWSQEEASGKIGERLKLAKDRRRKKEDQWRMNEETIFTAGRPSDGTGADDLTGLDLDSLESFSEINLNYAFKYIRFLHAQMSANPPTIIPTPTSQDIEDLESSRAADHIIHYGRKQHKAQDVQDLVNLNTLVYGIGWTDVRWDALKGEYRNVKEDGQFNMSGDTHMRSRRVWDVWVDSEAEVWEDVRFIFIRHIVPLEQAEWMFPQHKDHLQKARVTNAKEQFFDTNLQSKQEGVAIYEYIEKGLPWNGMVGRYAWVLEGGLILNDIQKNPFPNASFPVYPLTDVDVPGDPYGKAVLDYLVRAQEVLSALDSTLLDNIQSHGVVRLVLPDGAEVQDDGISNNGWEYVKIAGGGSQAPYFMSPPALMPDMYKFREQLIAGMEAIAGVNESMFGQQQREVSALSQQTAIEAGNLIRRRLFNKFTDSVVWMYSTYLANIIEHWKAKRMVEVVGEENTLSIAYYSGADIASGYSLLGEYGVSFSLDPSRRREEIMQLTPLFREAGVSPQQILSKLRLNDVQGAVDIVELAKRRQAEIFEEMIGKWQKGVPVQIEPRRYQEHKAMLDYAYTFVNTKKYDDLPVEMQDMIDAHIEAREKLAADQASPEAAAAMGPGVGVPGGAAMPAPGIM